MIELQADLEYVVSDRLKVSLDAIAQFCQRWNIVEFALFGSVLRDDFRPDSDVDVLVTYDPSHRLTLSHLLGMQEEIEHLFQRSVDLVEKKLLENPYLRSNILKTHQVIYASGRSGECFTLYSPATTQMFSVPYC
ncbi:nucleotidyltransferase family protein [Microcoleus sp. LAD1_D5]|uniref:nucleotidyltransferase family protein n=1 Tax=unclassified Microcoleus TaxID=2642155 RepID=UPI002FCEDE39